MSPFGVAPKISVTSPVSTTSRVHEERVHVPTRSICSGESCVDTIALSLFDPPTTILIPAGLSAERCDDVVCPGDDRDVLQCVVDRGAMPIGVHRRAAVLRNDHDVTLV